MADCRFFLLGRFSALADARSIDLPCGPARTLFKILLTLPGARTTDLVRWLGSPRAGPAYSVELVHSIAARLCQSLAVQCGEVQISHAGGQFALHLPADAWVDLKAMRAWTRIGTERETGGDVPGALAAYQEAECLFLGDLLEEEGNAGWVLAVRREVRAEYVEILSAMARCWRMFGNTGYADGFQAKARAMAPGF